MAQIDLRHGDCLDVMKTLEAGSVDMVLTDPPYGTTACKWDTVIDLDLMWEQLKRVTKKNGAIVMTASQPFTSVLVTSNLKMFKYCWVWDKGVSGSFANANYAPLKTHEDVCVFGESLTYTPQMTKRDKPAKIGGTSCGRQGGRDIKFNPKKLDANKIYTHAHPKTVQYFSPRAAGQRGLHPTQKPVALMEYLIKTYTNEGETVLDFTAGSFTTGVACLNTNRKFIGIERDPGYFKIGSERMRERWAELHDTPFSCGTTGVACVNTGRNCIGIEKDEAYFEIAQKRIEATNGEKETTA